MQPRCGPRGHALPWLVVATSSIELPEIDGLTWRPLGPDVVDAWHALVQVLLATDGGTEHLTAHDLRDELEPDWIDLATDSRLAVDSDGVARAFGLVQVRPGDVTLLRAACWGGVHPDYRDRGIGRALLGWQLDRAEAIVVARRATLGADTPAGALVIVEEQEGPTAGLLEESGFSLSRYFHVMRRDLAEPIPAPVVRDGVRLVTFADAIAADPGVDDAVRLAHNDAFVDHWGFQPWSADTWRRWETGQRDFRGDWSWVAVDGDQIAGYAMSAGFSAEWAELGWTQGWTSKLGVRAPWRGTGLAKALLTASMGSFAADGMEYAGLDVDSDNPSGAVGLYKNLGYAMRHRASHWTKDL
jgi:mycothiol synthase